MSCFEENARLLRDMKTSSRNRLRVDQIQAHSFDKKFEKIWYVLRPRSEHEYVTLSHRIVSLRSSKACSIISANFRSIELIDSAIMLKFSASESRNEQKISARKFYWTIHEEFHFVIFISRHENDSDTNWVRHRSCSSRKS